MHVGVPSGCSQFSGLLSPTSPRRRRARRHPLAELRCEAVQRGLRHSQRLQAVVGERDGDPGVLRGIRGRRAGVDDPLQPPYQLASGGAIVDAKQHVGADVRRGTFVERPCLDVVQLESDASGAGVDRVTAPPQWCSGISGGSGFGSARYGNVRRGGPARVVDTVPDHRTVAAFTSWVKIVSITSSLSALPPHVRCASPRRAASSTASSTRQDPLPDPAQDAWVTVAFTYHGLKALGVPQESLDSFAPEFRQGMAARAAGSATSARAPRALGAAARHPRRARRGRRAVARRAGWRRSPSRHAAPTQSCPASR